MNRKMQTDQAIKESWEGAMDAMAREEARRRKYDRYFRCATPLQVDQIPAASLLIEEEGEVIRDAEASALLLAIRAHMTAKGWEALLRIAEEKPDAAARKAASRCRKAWAAEAMQAGYLTVSPAGNPVKKKTARIGRPVSSWHREKEAVRRWIRDGNHKIVVRTGSPQIGDLSPIIREEEKAPVFRQYWQNCYIAPVPMATVTGRVKSCARAKREGVGIQRCNFPTRYNTMTRDQIQDLELWEDTRAYWEELNEIIREAEDLARQGM